MKCEEVRPLLDPLLDNELPTQPTALIMEHIRNCGDCQDVWDGLLSLRERMRAFVSNISIPERLLPSIDEVLQKEIRKQRAVLRVRNFILGSVAAALLLVPAAIFTLNNANIGSHEPASVQEIVHTFRQEYAKSPPVSSSLNLASISKRAGFPVTELKMPNWRLASAETLKMPNHSECIVKLTYVRKTAGKLEQITCYQACHGQITATGLKEHNMNGRYFCCGKISELSVVYWPNQGKDHLLVSALPERDLVNLAFGT